MMLTFLVLISGETIVSLIYRGKIRYKEVCKVLSKVWACTHTYAHKWRIVFPMSFREVSLFINGSKAAKWGDGIEVPYHMVQEKPKLWQFASAPTYRTWRLLLPSFLIATIMIHGFMAFYLFALPYWLEAGNWWLFCLYKLKVREVCHDYPVGHSCNVSILSLLEY